MPSYHPKTKRALPNAEDNAYYASHLLGYDFEDVSLAVAAIGRGDERTRSATLPCLRDFGDDVTIAAAVDVSGLSELLYPKQSIMSKGLVEVVRALLGAVYEDSGNKVEMLRAAQCLGLGPVEGDLLGVEELKYVKCKWEEVSVASEESLL